MKFGVISDTHAHNWNSFSTTNADGVNSRLQIILDEKWRCANAVKDMGGNLLIHCGDMFHVHGHIAPSVLNPTLDLYRKIEDELKVHVVILAGNHDLEAKDSARVSNAVTAFEGVGCTVVHKPVLHFADCYFVPWMKNIDDLKKAIEVTGHRSMYRLFMHAPIDGVIKGLPDKGLTDTYLDSLGYKQIFCGHYHDHKVMGPKSNIVSVGALTHQTWGDVGSKAGFLTVDDDKITWHASRAPKFVEIDGSMSETDILEACDGNYVRARMATNKPAEIEAMRAHLESTGAKGVVILAEPPKSIAPARTTSSKFSGTSLESSVKDWIDSSTITHKTAVHDSAVNVLKTVQAR